MTLPISLFKLTFLLAIARTTEKKLISRAIYWLPIAVIYVLADTTALYLEHHKTMTELIPMFFYSVGEILLLRFVFNISLKKAFILHLAILPLYVFPEVIMGGLVRMIYHSGELVIALNTQQVVLNYTLSIVLVWYFRSYIHHYIRYITSIQVIHENYILIAGLNMWWLYSVFYDSVFIYDMLHFETTYIYFHIGFVIFINGIGFYYTKVNRHYFFKQTHSQESQISQAIMQDYLNQVHDFRNIEQVLKAYTIEDAPRTLVATMIELKIIKAEQNGIRVNKAETTIENILEIETNNITSLDYAVIVGILFDNAIDHLMHNHHLKQVIDIDYQDDQALFTIINPVTPTNAKLLKGHQKYTINQSTQQYTDGFGLHNARLLAIENKLALRVNIEAYEVTIKVIGQHKQKQSKVSIF